MNTDARVVIILGVFLLTFSLVMVIAPSLFGGWGGKVQAAVFSMMLIQGVSWFSERQQLKKLERSPE